ncbi:MAG: hypothetical protein II243_06310 [Lachnospiraceae bacterium]|nr:hypothetical protein [Lachnospiraceae bacterium]MBQ2407393.1 hypothetical protein [Lachnospiraceae bacterium]
MEFKQLKWTDHLSNDLVIGSDCCFRVYDSIKIEFKIAYEPKENQYYLYSFGIGSLRRLMPDKFATVKEAKTTAYEIYKNEICRIKRAIDNLI